MKKITVLTGAGISAESGLKTFRDSNGLWENYSVYEVATPEAWYRNMELVLEFYNQRRIDVSKAMPNQGHLALAELQNHFEVNIVTQNIDDLHERAGSKNVIHLHGEIFKSRSVLDGSVYPIKGLELKKGDLCPNGGQLRPHIVWFGEPVPAIEEAIPSFLEADIIIVTGTSLEVYPAAGLINYAANTKDKFLVDPHPPGSINSHEFKIYPHQAAKGLPELVNNLKETLK
jgi:NAD-dependent deacetylase